MTDHARLAEYYKGLDDDDLAAEYGQGVSAHRPDAWALLEAEVMRRNAAAPAGAPRVDPRAQAARSAARELEAEIADLDRRVGVGTFVAIVGVVVTAVSYLGASAGGTYLVAWGAIVFGAYRALVARSQRETAIQRLAALGNAPSAQPHASTRGETPPDAETASALAALDAEFAALERDGKASGRVKESYARQRAALLRQEES